MEQKRFTVRMAEIGDLPVIMGIYDRARTFMAENGNPTQWGKNYPARDLLEEDIARDGLFVITEGAQVRGVFMFVVGPDPTYAVIENGAWHSDKIYGTIHRIAGDGTGGIFGACLDFCRKKRGYLRIDTHEDNKIMQHVVTKAGFQRCGIIYTHNGTPRIAFDITYY